VAKNAPRIEAIGTIDELNSALGVALAEPMPGEVRDCLNGVQHDLFDCGAELSAPGRALIAAAHVQRIESALDHFNAALAPLKEFILPAGTRSAACAHLARAICRRAERAVVTLSASEQVSPHLAAYINRLSDLLFVLARILNRDGGAGDVFWQPERHSAE
jgi:cob(I)alamin adenosyltransferase